MILNDSFSRAKKLSSLLESLEYSDKEYDQSMVPIIESKETSSHLIMLENLQKYATIYCNDNLGFALKAICEAHNVDSNSIEFIVKEENIIADENLLSIVEGMMGEGIPVYAVPISENDVVAVLGSMCLEQAELDNDYEYWIGTVFCEDSSNRSDFNYTYFDFMKDNPNADSRLQQFFAGKFIGHPGAGGSDGSTKFDQEHIKNLKFIFDEIKKKNPNASTEELERKWLGSVSLPFFKDRYKAFKNQALDDPKVNEKIEQDNEMYNLLRLGTEKGGVHLNDKAARETEEGFNKAKQDTLDQFKYMSENLPKSSVIGTTDEKAVERVKELSKMVENEKFPKSWIGKKIAWLRSLYRNVMFRWTIAQRNRSMSNIGGWVIDKLKKFAAFILRTIDKLAQKLQNAVG